jgi:hypothetical protein
MGPRLREDDVGNFPWSSHPTISALPIVRSVLQHILKRRLFGEISALFWCWRGPQWCEEMRVCWWREVMPGSCLQGAAGRDGRSEEGAVKFLSSFRNPCYNMRLRESEEVMQERWLSG